MLGFIKNLAKKADNSFYLELKDSEEVKSSESKKPELPPVVAEAVTTVSEKVAQVASATVEAATAAKKETEAAAAKAAKIEVAKSAKAAKTEAAKSAKAQKEADAAEKAAITAKKKELPVEKNFSTKYLGSSGSSERRRPGANMNAFLEMAKTAKTPGQK
jgi:hypothetical protein